MGSPIRPDLAAPARILSPDEFDQVQGLTPDGVKAAKLPPVAPPFTPRPYASSFAAEGTAPQNTVHPSRLVKPTTVGGVLGQQVQGMVDNPAQTATSFGATMNPVGGIAAVGMMGRDIIDYAAQKAAEMTLDPATRKFAEADPERTSGASAAVQGGMLALFPILHKVGKSASGLTDFGDGMMEAGAAGLRGMDGIPRTADAAATMAKLNAAPASPPRVAGPAPHEQTRAQFEATGEDLLHGTTRKFDTFAEKGAPTTRGAKPTAGRYYFTDKPEVAHAFANNSGGFKVANLDYYAKTDTGDSYYDLDPADREATLDNLRTDIQKKIDAGHSVDMQDENGNPVPLTDASKLTEADVEDGQVRIWKKGQAPRVIQTKVYGPTLDLTGDTPLPDDVRAALSARKIPDKLDEISFQHEFNAKLIDAAREMGYGKVRVPDVYESGFRSTIGLPEYIGMGRDAHRAFVESALAEGKHVPPEVLKDYPDLAARAPAAPAPEVSASAPAPAPTQAPPALKSPARLAVDKHVATVTDAFSRMFAPVKAITETLQKGVAPATVSPEAAQAALVVRASTGDRAMAYEQDAYKLDEGRRAIGLLPESDQLGFIDAYEGGDTQPSDEFAPLATGIKAGLDARVDAIRALGTGKLESVIENYFPHIWTDASRAAIQLKGLGAEGEAASPEAAPAAPSSGAPDPATAGQSLAETAIQGGQGRMAGKRPFEGSKSFLKKRTIPTTKEGMALGLVPVTTNPVDLALLKMREMDKYLVAHQSLNELKEQGLVQFVRAGELPPDGHVAINDKIATVFGPKTGGVSLPEGAATPGEAPPPKVSTVRDPAGRLRSSLTRVPDAELQTEWARLAELNGQEEALHASVQESGYRADYNDLPRTEKLGAKGQEDLPDASGTVDPDVLASHNQIIRDYRKSTIVRAARDKAMQRIEAEMAKRPSASDFNFGANEYRQTGQLPEGMRPLRPDDVTVHGTRIMGQYYAPEAVARVINNHLSPGLAGNALFDAYRGLGNTLNQAQLGLSAFHLGFTSMDATVSRTALGLEHFASGAPLEGAKAIASAPVAALPGILQGTIGDASNRLLGTDFQWGLGARIRAAYLSPENAPPDMLALANAVKEAGGRIKQDAFYSNNVFEKYTAHLRAEWDALKAGDLKGAAAHDFAAGNLSIPSILELTAKPLMEHIVPLQKLQVFGEMAQKALADLPPDASLMDRRAALASAWDSVDNRMGQLVYDNLFWHRTAKDLAMASVRSVGWNVGTIRELGGGVADLAGMAKDAVTGHRPELTHRAAYATALPITVGMMGAAYQYLRTGEGPQELKDYFYPRTGEVDADGNPERVQLPSYMKDVAAYSSHPWETIKHKRAPILSGVFQMLDNEDYYGDQIRNAQDPLVVQAKQEAAFVSKQFMPFAVAGAQESAQRGDQSTATKAGSFFGVTPAPRSAVRSDAQNLIAEYLAERQQTGATPEDVEARQARAQVLAGLRGADGVDLEQAIGDAIEQHQLTPPDLAHLMQRAGMSPVQEKFKRLTTAQAVAVFGKANDREKALFLDALLSKLQRMNPGDAPPDAAGIPVGN